MEIKARSVRAEQAQLADAMRRDGCSWRQVADVFVTRWGLSYLQSFRLAHGLSQQQAADRYNIKWQPDRPLTGKNISYWEMWPAKTGKEPSLGKLSKLAEVYECSVSDLVSDVSNRDRRDDLETEDPVLRRTFVGLASTSALGAILDLPRDERRPDTEPLASVITAHIIGTEPGQPADLPGIAALADAVNRVRQRYQRCRYSEVINTLPRLLELLDAAGRSLDGDARSKAFTLAADAYHVAAGLLLKLDDHGLASLAADRSMRAAQASEDPVTVCASARIVAHVLMAGRHLPTAVETASSHAARLDRAVPAQTPESLSVYGSLLLRGSIAAARHGRRATARELLGEADEAARRLGSEANLRWTAFGAVNAKVHRVHVAVTLGDAGTAIDVARAIDLSMLTVTERKASLLVDGARAFLQLGRHEQALLALHAAHKVAHEEVAQRPAVHRLVRDLTASAPPSVRRHATQFAAQAGVPL